MMRSYVVSEPLILIAFLTGARADAIKIRIGWAQAP